MTTAFDIAEATKLLALADAVDVPSKNPDEGGHAYVGFDLGGGWRMVVFYDAGDLDYIDHFVSPEGAEIDFWDWPDGEAKDLLMSWQGVPRPALP